MSLLRSLFSVRDVPRPVLAVVGGCLVAAVAVGVGAAASGLPADAAFEVGDTVVTEEDLAGRLDVLDALYGVREPTDADRRDEFRRESAKTVALGMVLDEAAADEQVEVPDSEVEAAYARFTAERFPDGQAGMVRLLGTVGASEADVRDEIRRQLLTKRLYDTAVAGALETPTEEEVRAYYDAHADRFAQPEARHLRNIVVADETVAVQVLESARRGTDFAELARTYSRDTETRDSGGDLQFVARSQVEDGYAGPAFDAAPGALFGPVQTAGGWNVGQVAEVRPGRRLAFEEVAQQARAALENERRITAWRQWVDDRVAAVGVTY
uniref:peptidylprolyl isomerase n=1 Tax=Pseudonocardia pini TaxID=2758030 RepID=UPI0015F02420